MRLWFFLICLVSATSLQGQSNSLFISGSKFLGVDSYFLNYERLINVNSNSGNQIRIKASYGSVTTLVSENNPSEYEDKYITIEGVYLLGKKDHYLELAVGPAVGSSDGFDHYLGLNWQYSAGWRYQKGALMTRIGYSSLERLYISAGFSF